MAGETPSGTGWDLWAVGRLQLLIGTLLGAVTSLTFVAFTGGAVVWSRARALGLPPDQVVTAVPRTELIAIGASSLATFVLLGLLAVAFVYLQDPHGCTSLPTRIGLLALVGIEAGVAVYYEVEPEGEEWALTAVLLSLVLFSTGLVASRLSAEVPPTPPPPEPPPPEPVSDDLAGLLASVLNGIKAWGVATSTPPGTPEPPKSPAEKTAEGEEPAPKDKAAESKPPPVETRLTFWGTISTLGLIVIALVFLWFEYEDWWLVAAVGAAFALYILVLSLARASGKRFWATAVAIIVAVGMYGAVLSALRYWQTLQVQPVAVLRAGEARPVCGIYIAEAKDRLYLARLDDDARRLSTKHAKRSPKNGSTGQLFWVLRDDVSGWALGELQSQPDAELALKRLSARVRRERRARVTRTVTAGETRTRQIDSADKAKNKTTTKTNTEKKAETKMPRGAGRDTPRCTIYSRLSDDQLKAWSR